MTARIKRVFTFQSGAYFNSSMYMNSYTVDINFSVETESIIEQNIALERIKYFLNESLEHSILIHDIETAQIKKYQEAELKVCTLPEEPYDQIIGIMLILKLNAITENKLIINEIAITSRLSDDIYCIHSVDENIGPFAESGWWHDNSPKINTLKPNKTKKIVKLVKSVNSWDELDLSWGIIKKEKSIGSSEVVFATFDSKTDK
jgi:hypothetical protein